MLISDTLSNVRKWRFHPNSKKTAAVIYEFHLLEGKCNAGRTGLFVLRRPNLATVTTCFMQPQPYEFDGTKRVLLEEPKSPFGASSGVRLASGS
jgi:hypothetical protein